MDTTLSYREEQFSAAEAAAATGLSLTLQRDWRALGHLPPRTSGHARFSPRELAEMSVMVVLRQMGLPLPQCRAAAVKAAPSVLFIALTDHPETLAVDAPSEEAKHYIASLERRISEGYLRRIAGVGRQEPHIVLIQGDRFLLLPSLQDSKATDIKVRASAFAYLPAVAAGLADTVKKPLFTLVPPQLE